MLTPTQFAKLIVAWPQINRQVKIEMYKAMHGGQAPASADDMELSVVQRRAWSWCSPTPSRSVRAIV